MRNYIKQILVDSLDLEEMEERSIENRRRLRHDEEVRREEEARNKRYDCLQDVINKGKFNGDGAGPARIIVAFLMGLAIVSLILSAIFGN